MGVSVTVTEPAPLCRLERRQVQHAGKPAYKILKLSRLEFADSALSGGLSVVISALVNGTFKCHAEARRWSQS